MKREFDWTQEFQEMMNGQKVRILCRDARGYYPIVGLCLLTDGTEIVMRWTGDGTSGETSSYDLRPLTPKKHVRWVNCYPDSSEQVGYAYSSKEEADRRAVPTRTACIRVEYTEGQFDE